MFAAPSRAPRRDGHNRSLAPLKDPTSGRFKVTQLNSSDVSAPSRDASSDHRTNSVAKGKAAYGAPSPSHAAPTSALPPVPDAASPTTPGVAPVKQVSYGYGSQHPKPFGLFSHSGSSTSDSTDDSASNSNTMPDHSAIPQYDYSTTTDHHHSVQFPKLYRPSNIYMEQHPHERDNHDTLSKILLGIHDSVGRSSQRNGRLGNNDAPFDDYSVTPYRGGGGDTRRTSNASHHYNDNSDYLTPPSTSKGNEFTLAGATRDLLRYRLQLKAQSPQALAVKDDMAKWQEEQAQEQSRRRSHQQDWRDSLDRDFAAKQHNQQRERELATVQRTTLQNNIEREKMEERARKARLAQEMGDYRKNELLMATQNREEQRQKRMRERAAMDAGIAEQLNAEKQNQRQLARETHATAKDEWLQHERERLAAKTAAAERKRADKQAADEAKQADVEDQQSQRAEQRRRQKEFLDMTMRDVEYQKRKNKRKQEMERNDIVSNSAAMEEESRREKEREAQKRRDLARSLDQQMKATAADKNAEKKARMDRLRDEAEHDAVMHRQAKELDKQSEGQRKARLHNDLRQQMEDNFQKSLQGILLGSYTQ